MGFTAMSLDLGGGCVDPRWEAAVTPLGRRGQRALLWCDWSRWFALAAQVGHGLAWTRSTRRKLVRWWSQTMAIRTASVLTQQSGRPRNWCTSNSPTTRI